MTGASGFIGTHCLEPLKARGFEVHAVARQRPKDAVAGVSWYEADLKDRAEQRGVLEKVKPSHLLHLAWFVVPGELIGSAENYSWVASSMDLVQGFAEFGGKRVTVCGSGYEYDWSYGYCSETLTPTEPDTTYGACKHALDVMTRSFAASAGLSVAWGRVFFLYGPHEHPKRLVSSVIRSLLAEQPAKSSHGRQVRDYMHVEDVANGLVAVLDSEVTGPLNVSSGQATTIREIVLGIGRLMGRENLLEIGAIPARANDAPLVIGDNTRITSSTDWRQKYDLEAGLAHTIEWWRRQS